MLFIYVFFFLTYICIFFVCCSLLNKVVCDIKNRPTFMFMSSLYHIPIRYPSGHKTDDDDDDDVGVWLTSNQSRIKCIMIEYRKKGV